METIDGENYFEFDTVHCISLVDSELYGFLYAVGNSSHMSILNNGIKYHFRYRTIRPLRMVLIEKEYKIEHHVYEHTQPIQIR